MAINDNAILAANMVRYYTAPVGTPCPTPTALKANRETALAAWEELGNTSTETPFNAPIEGGETQVKGTVQNPNAKTSTSDRKVTVEVELAQFDEASVRHFLGANTVKKDGVLYAKTKPKPTQVAVLALAEDEEAFTGFYAAKADLLGNGAINLDDLENIDALPIKFTILEKSGEPGLFGIIPLTVKDDEDEDAGAGD